MTAAIGTTSLEPRGNDGANDTGNVRQSASDLHLNLINFLFSLSIGRVAIEASRIIHDASNDWVNVKYWPSYTHLALGSLIIILSWLGWKKSRYAAAKEITASFFSRSFVELCIDLLLVVLYFRLVSSAERAEFGVCAPPNACDEARIVACIFTLYFFWDLITKWEDVRFRGRRAKPGVTSRIQVSLYTMALGWLAVWAAKTVATSPAAVCFFDTALMGLAVFFREGKEYLSGRSRGGLLLVAVGWFYSALFLAVNTSL